MNPTINPSSEPNNLNGEPANDNLETGQVIKPDTSPTAVEATLADALQTPSYKPTPPSPVLDTGATIVSPGVGTVVSMDADRPADSIAPMPLQSPVASPVPEPDAAMPTLVMPVASPSRSRKKKILFIASPLVVLALAAGVVFGLYLPNTPNGVWNAGINRTGKALDKIVMSATEVKQLEAYKTSEIIGNVTAKVGGDTYSGNLTSKFDDTKSDSGLDVTLASQTEGTKKINAKLLADLPSGSVYPNLYFKISGLKNLGLDEFVGDISSFDNRWVLVDSDYLKSLGSSLSGGDEQKQSPVTAADIATASRAVSAATKDYLFSTSDDKGVFVKKSFVSKEKVDGMSTYHYKVGVNKDHAKDYCVAVRNAVLSTEAYKKLSGADGKAISESKKAVPADCDDSVKESFKDNEAMDLWIDSKYKLIHKIRQYEQNSTTEYTDLGQNYKGGDEVSLFVEHTNTKDKSSAKFTLDTSLKTNVTSATAHFVGGAGSDAYDVSAKLTAKPLKTAVTFTKPEGAITIQDLLAQLGLGDVMSTSNSSPLIEMTGADAERQADIQALQTQLEAHFAINDFYPTLADLNNATWRSTNMKSLDSGALTDPEGKTATLASTPTKGRYSYQPASCDAQGCQDYTLTAILSDGSSDGSSYTETAL